VRQAIAAADRDVVEIGGKLPTSTLVAVAAVYWIGLALGLGVSVGILFAGLLASGRAGVAAAVVGAAAAGAALGFLVSGSGEAIAGAIGGVAGAGGSAAVVRGALRRGGVRGATAALIGVAALVCALLALVPLLGYVEAVLVPALGARVRGRQSERYAGLRILARD
jgi:hypothetical protein